MPPEVIRSLAFFQVGSAIDCTPTVITRPVFFQVSTTARASAMVRVIGFSQYTSLPAGLAADAQEGDADRLVGAVDALVAGRGQRHGGADGRRGLEEVASVPGRHGGLLNGTGGGKCTRPARHTGRAFRSGPLLLEQPVVQL